MGKIGLSAIAATLAVLLLILLQSGTASAQYICPNGPRPGERQVGVTSNGGALCVPIDPAQDQPAAPPVYQPAPPPPDRFGAFAIEDKGRLDWAANYDSLEAAEAAALATCAKNGGTNCRRLVRFGNQCAAHAVDLDGIKLFSGYDDFPSGAERKAMAACNAENPQRLCRLMGLGVCAGANYPASINEQAARATPSDVEARSANLDGKQYWGAAAVSADGAYAFSVNQSSKAIAEKSALAGKECAGHCRIAASFTRQCVGIAWPQPKQAVPVEIALGYDSTPTQNAARAQCTAKYGGHCVAMSRCSGRYYALSDPGQEPR